jgi:hypothetical protein
VTESDDLRTFIREITLRFERGMERISREIRQDSRRYFDAFHAEQREHWAEQRAYRAEQREYRAEQRAHRAEQTSEQREHREKLDAVLAESRAGRQALLHLLDTLRGNGGTAPSA